MTRRIFLAAFLLPPPTQTTALQVVVLETFGLNGQTAAALVHHTEPATREQLAQWLRGNPKNSITVHSKTGEEFAATIFRVRICFGRGLILFERPIPIREHDALTLVV